MDKAPQAMFHCKAEREWLGVIRKDTEEAFKKFCLTINEKLVCFGIFSGYYLTIVEK